MPQFLVQVDFHHGVDSLAVRVTADDRDAAERVVFEQFETHSDWAIESAQTVREADQHDEQAFPTLDTFQ